MELRHLRYFVAIAEEQSFTRAAERLWIAQPGLSTQIRKLESELGVRLFDRHTRGVDLTQAGLVLLERARAALAAMEEVSATGRDVRGGVTGRVRVGVAAEAHCGRGAELLRRFAEERPGVELTVLEGYGGTLWRDLRAGRIDTLLAPAGHRAPDLKALELDSVALVVVVGVGHPLAGIGPIAAEELDGERIVITGHRDGAVFDQTVEGLLRELGIEPVFVPGPPGPALRAMGARSDAAVLTAVPDPFPSRAVARPLSPRRCLTFELLWRDEKPSPAVAEFIRLATASVSRARPARPAAAALM